jgi:hypothetical protein
MGGYLKQTGERMDPVIGKVYYSLSIPNMEVKIIYSQIIDNFFATKTGELPLETMLKALTEGDVSLFQNNVAKSGIRNI